VSRWLFIAFAVLVAGGVTWYNVVCLEDTFGSGPPYYGRTVNMDKWFDPRPMLVAVDAGTLLVVLTAAWWFRRGERRDGRE
jgi:hypothetical protein